MTAEIIAKSAKQDGKSPPTQPFSETTNKEYGLHLLPQEDSDTQLGREKHFVDSRGGRLGESGYFFRPAQSVIENMTTRHKASLAEGGSGFGRIFSSSVYTTRRGFYRASGVLIARVIFLGRDLVI